MPISPDFTSVYAQSFEIDYFDCDIHGHLKLVDLCAKIQVVASQHSVLGGISFWDLQEDNQAWVVNKFKVEIDKMPKWQDTITITTWIEYLDGVKSVRNFDVTLNGEKIIRSSSLWVILKTERRRPEPMKLPHEHFEKFKNKIALHEPFSKFVNTDNGIVIDTDSVKYSDLDMVNHVTNIKYLEWVIDAVHANNTDIGAIKTVDMLFKRELVFPTTFTVVQNQTNTNQYEIKDTDGNINFQCILA